MTIAAGYTGGITSAKSQIRIKGKQKRNLPALSCVARVFSLPQKDRMWVKVTSFIDSQRSSQGQGDNRCLAVWGCSSIALNGIQTTTESQRTECVHREFEVRAGHSTLKVRTSRLWKGLFDRWSDVCPVQEDNANVLLRVTYSRPYSRVNIQCTLEIRGSI